jgi:hypothetical protein
MAQLVVRNISVVVKQRLQRRAKRHGRSLGEEVRDILRTAAMEEATPADSEPKSPPCFGSAAWRRIFPNFADIRSCPTPMVRHEGALSRDCVEDLICVGRLPACVRIYMSGKHFAPRIPQSLPPIAVLKSCHDHSVHCRQMKPASPNFSPYPGSSCCA